jgi:hypothetical protein
MVRITQEEEICPKIRILASVPTSTNLTTTPKK